LLICAGLRENDWRHVPGRNCPPSVVENGKGSFTVWWPSAGEVEGAFYIDVIHLPLALDIIIRALYMFFALLFIAISRSVAVVVI
jgi:hypothetical protein